MLAAGDQLLSLNGECVNHYTPEYVYQVIEKTNDPIEVTIKKDEEVAGKCKYFLLAELVLIIFKGPTTIPGIIRYLSFFKRTQMTPLPSL